MTNLGHDSNTTLDEHDSPQWYDIVHFEHKLSWLCIGLGDSSGQYHTIVESRQVQSKVMRAYAQSGQYHTIYGESCSSNTNNPPSHILTFTCKKN